MSQTGNNSSVVSGIAVYAEWQTTDDDWNNIRTLWSG
jgi:hypothetical protein